MNHQYLDGSDVVCVFEDTLDGFAAAYCVWKMYPNAQFHRSVSWLTPTQLHEKQLIILGVNMPLVNYIELSRHCRDVLIVDHRQTLSEQWRQLGELPQGVQVLYHPNQSIASLVWNHQFTPMPIPVLIQYIEDKTLWRYQFPQTRAVTTALIGYPQDFKVWDDLIQSNGVYDLHEEGRIMLRRLQKDVEMAIRTSKRRINIGGYDVPAVNISPTLANDAGILLAKGEPFGVSYWDETDGRVFDLISTQQGIAVHELVRAFNGYGSSCEARFKVPKTHPLANV